MNAALEPPRTQAGDALGERLQRHRRWFVLTGAGVSTDSGIPAYRDAAGRFLHGQPMQLAAFRASERARQRYWARSAAGFSRVHRAQPNAAHRALADLERAGLIAVLVTQNVDGLHQKAGSRNVIELHGDLATVECWGCSEKTSRAEVQAELLARNPRLGENDGELARPDGDAEPEPGGEALELSLDVPECRACGGILKPHVVFFGETVPPERVAAAYRELDGADAVLVVGSSLMVFSGYRFVRRAAAAGKPIVIVNQGMTRADGIAEMKIEQPCREVLARAAARFARASDSVPSGREPRWR